MDSVNTIAVPLKELVCSDCGSGPPSASQEVFLKYEVTSVEVEGANDVEPVSVTLDIQKLFWRQVSKGMYRAEAVFHLPCPSCESEHEFRHQMEAPVVFLKQLGRCGACAGGLELQGETIEYVDSTASGPSIEIKGQLVCADCKSVKNEQKSISCPDFQTIRTAAEIDLPLNESAVVRHRRNESDEQDCRFAAALSFSGANRDFVREVADQLTALLGTGRVFYDHFFEAELARPGLDAYLQNIYQNESHLVVVFLCEAYERSDWCGLEWRAVREILKSKRESSLMLMRFDQAEIPGLFNIDGYVNLASRSSEDAATLIKRRFDFEFGRSIDG